jgi:membrane protein
MPLSERQLRMVNTGRTMLRKFIDDRCTTYAAALAFSSMLSIIPFLAILFAILKVLDVHTALTPVILSSVSAGSQEIVARLLRYIHNTRVASLGVVGLVTLFLSIMVTLDNVEEAFNQIWGLERGKAYHLKVRDYLLVIFGIPLLIALAVTITTGLQNQWVIKWFFRLPGFGSLFLMLFRLVPYLSIWIALSCLYLFIPNTKVRLQNALTGALVAGTAWQIAQWAFIHFQLGVSRSNAIYGTMSLLPVFMIWIYTGWIIVLAGMELVCHLQGGPLSADAADNGSDGDSVVKTVDSPVRGED